VNVTSIFTTTGYATEDYQLWGPAAVPVFFFLTVIGGCSGSTAGGMKIFRLQLSLIILREQTIKLIHPRAVICRRYNGQLVGDDILISAVAFSFVFLVTLAVLTLLLTFLGLDFITALSGIAQSMTSTGPGLGPIIGPAGNFQTLPEGAKLLLCGGMVLGRLEFLSLLVLFSPVFWRG
jgi:trk system potassium uptake protein TrkH